MRFDIDPSKKKKISCLSIYRTFTLLRMERRRSLVSKKGKNFIVLLHMKDPVEILTQIL